MQIKSFCQIFNDMDLRRKITAITEGKTSPDPEAVTRGVL